MAQLLTSLMISAALLLGMLPAAEARKGPPKEYPAFEEAWDGTDYRALIERFEDVGLALPTLSDAATKPIFERMVAADNIPLRVGLNKELAVTLRFQKLDSALDPIHKLQVIYTNEMQKGKPYAPELARLMVYEAKVSGAMLNLSEGVLAGLDTGHKRYQARVAELEKMKDDARQLYLDLVQRLSETSVYAKPDIMKMAAGALDELPAYHPVLTSEDRLSLTQKLTQQISATSDQELKKTLSELHDAIKHRRVRT